MGIPPLSGHGVKPAPADSFIRLMPEDRRVAEVGNDPTLEPANHVTLQGGNRVTPACLPLADMRGIQHFRGGYPDGERGPAPPGRNNPVLRGKS